MTEERAILYRMTRLRPNHPLIRRQQSFSPLVRDGENLSTVLQSTRQRRFLVRMKTMVYDAIYCRRNILERHAEHK